jgi:DNA repair exonuclease SbcCD ATPase subunit
MTIALFRSLSAVLDALILEVDADLPLADDIHRAVRKVGEYMADLVRLPVALAKLEAHKTSIDASIPAREKAARKANGPILLAEGKLKKLNESLARNLAADKDDDSVPVVSVVPAAFEGIVLPTRKELIERLRADVSVAETELAAARAKAKKAESNRKGAVTRSANLAKEIDAAKKAIVDHAGRVDETIKVLRKTINHLRNRQEKRVAKRTERSAAAIPVETASADESPKGPSDEDIRKMAESEGLSIECPDDLKAARQLFFN